jgi:hypothetical protein
VAGTGDPPVDAEADFSGWPSQPGSGVGTEARAIFEARIAVREKQIDADFARAKADADANIADQRAYFDALYTLAAGGIDRARSGAQTVQTAAAAIGTLYAGVLGVTFSVSDRPLPARGLLAPLFLGLALVLSTMYLAYLNPRSRQLPAPLNTGVMGTAALNRIRSFMEMTRAVIRPQARSLRGAIVALAIGVAYLAAPLVSPPAWMAFGIHTSVAATSASKSLPPWPKPPAKTNADATVLYKAQVAETAKARSDALAVKPVPGSNVRDAAALLWGLTLGLVVLLVAMLTGTSSPDSGEDQTGSP